MASDSVVGGFYERIGMLLLKLKAINAKDYSNIYDIRVNSDDISSYNQVKLSSERTALQIKMRNGSEHLIDGKNIADMDKMLEGLAHTLYGS